MIVPRQSIRVPGVNRVTTNS